MEELASLQVENWLAENKITDWKTSVDKFDTDSNSSSLFANKGSVTYEYYNHKVKLQNDSPFKSLYNALKGFPAPAVVQPIELGENVKNFIDKFVVNAPYLDFEASRVAYFQKVTEPLNNEENKEKDQDPVVDADGGLAGLPVRSNRSKRAVATEDFIKQIDSMTVLELNNLVKALEDNYGVNASAAAVIVSNSPGNIQPDEPEEQTEFKVILKNFGAKK